MFITIQFPIVDYRYMHDDVARLDRPSWPMPNPEEDWMLYFGHVQNRSKFYKGPYDDEKKYCSAKSVFNFSGAKGDCFYSWLKVPFRSRILFRRFRSDGKFLARFEIGLIDEFEDPSDNETNSRVPLSALYEHINRYLLCPLQVKVGSRLSQHVPLIHCGKLLAEAYYWSTCKSADKRTFDKNLIENNVSPCEPVVLVHVNSSYCDLASLAYKEVDSTYFSLEGSSLYYDRISHKSTGGNNYIKTWIIATKINKGTMPVFSRDFHFFEDVIRYLRINLLRIHSEKVTFHKLNEALSKIGTQDESLQFSKALTQKRVLLYLNTILTNLSKNNRNNYPQKDLVTVAFKLDELSSDEDLESQIDGLKILIQWLENFKEQNECIINFSQQIINQMGDQISIGTLNGNFINKSSLVNSLNTISSSSKWDDKAKQELIEIGKKIEDSEDVAAGSVYDKLTEEIAKPAETQDKSKLKKFWDGLVKVMPDALTIGKTVASIISLF